MTEATTLVPVKTDQLDPASDNPRTDLGDLAGLASSIAEVGILEPIIVTPGTETGRYTIIAGHRRHAAAALVNVTDIEVIVQAVDNDADRQRMMLIENLHREDLTVLDKARGFKALADGGLSQRDIAGQVGVSQATVSKHLSLLKLPDALLAMVNTGELSQEAAVTMTGLPAEARKEIVTEVEEGIKSENPMSAMEIARSITWAKEEAETEAAFAKEVAGLKSAGVTFVDEKDVKWSAAKSGNVALSAMYWMPKKKHEKEPCRAVSIRFGSHLVEVCTNPKAHPEPASSARSGAKAKKETDAEKAKRERGEHFRGLMVEAGERRRAWLRMLPSSPSLLTATIQLVLRVPVEYFSVGDVPDAMGVKDEEALLEATSSETPARKALFLMAAFDADEVMDVRYGPGDAVADKYSEPRCQAYLEIIAALGYEVSWVEARYAGMPYEEPQMPGTSSPATEEGASDAEGSASPDADSSTSDEGTESVPDDGTPTITIKEGKGKKYHINCSACGQVGYNTTEEMAKDRAAAHLQEQHGTEAAA